MACVEAATQLQEGRIERIILTRPVVGVDENIGFLPGSMADKMKPWVQPMLEVIEFVCPRAPPLCCGAFVPLCPWSHCQ